MRNATPYYLGNGYNFETVIEPSDGTNLIEVFTVTQETGLRITNGTVANEDASAVFLQLWRGADASSAIPIYSSLINAEAGFDTAGTEPASPLFNDTDTPGYSQDANGNYYRHFSNGQKLFAKVTSAVSSNLYIAIEAFDYEAE